MLLYSLVHIQVHYILPDRQIPRISMYRPQLDSNRLLHRLLAALLQLLSPWLLMWLQLSLLFRQLPWLQVHYQISCIVAWRAHYLALSMSNRENLHYPDTGCRPWHNNKMLAVPKPLRNPNNRDRKINICYLLQKKSNLCLCTGQGGHKNSHDHLFQDRILRSSPLNI